MPPHELQLIIEAQARIGDAMRQVQTINERTAQGVTQTWQQANRQVQSATESAHSQAGNEVVSIWQDTQGRFRDVMGRLVVISDQTGDQITANMRQSGQQMQVAWERFTSQVQNRIRSLNPLARQSFRELREIWSRDISIMRRVGLSFFTVMESGFRRVTGAARGLGRAVTGVGRGIGRATTSLGGLSLLGGSLLATQRAVSLTFEEQRQEAFFRATRRDAQQRAQLEAFVERQRGGLFTQQQLREAVTAGRRIEQPEDLMRLVQALRGASAAEGDLALAITAVQRAMFEGEAELAERFGLLLREANLTETSNRLFGKKVTQLTAAEKAQVVYAEAIRQSADFQELEIQMLKTAAGQWQLFKNRVDDALRGLGNRLKPVLEGILGFLSEPFARLRAFGQDLFNAFVRLFRDLGIVIRNFAINLKNDVLSVFNDLLAAVDDMLQRAFGGQARSQIDSAVSGLAKAVEGLGLDTTLQSQIQKGIRGAGEALKTELESQLSLPFRFEVGPRRPVGLPTQPGFGEAFQRLFAPADLTGQLPAREEFPPLQQPRTIFPVPPPPESVFERLNFDLLVPEDTQAKLEMLSQAQQLVNDTALSTSQTIISAWGQIASATDTMVDDVLVAFGSLVLQIVQLIQNLQRASAIGASTGSLGTLGGIGIGLSLVGTLVGISSQSKRNTNDALREAPRFSRAAR